MSWKANTPPMAPNNLRIERDVASARNKIVWDKSALDMDGDSSFFYVLYKFSTANPTQNDIDNNKNILAITSLKEVAPQLVSSQGNFYFGVTALDRYGYESTLSNIIQLLPPETPVLGAPFNNALNQRDTLTLSWAFTQNAFEYTVQVADNDAFTGTLLVNKTLTDTICQIQGMAGMTQYYWRVKASNTAGESGYSFPNNFTTGFPQVTTLLEPPHATTGVSINPTFKWSKIDVATKYRFQFASSITITAQSLLLDTLVTDTTISLSKLALSKNYFWRVASVNEFGQSLWSSTFGFKTQTSVQVEEEKTIPDFYELYQNFPNPFNPTTRITFAIPLPETVEVKVFDILGGEIATLVSQPLSPGKYSVEWNGVDSLGRHVPSGVYFYRIKAGKFTDSKKMIFMK